MCIAFSAFWLRHCECSVFLPHGAMGWSGMCYCGISWPYPPIMDTLGRKIASYNTVSFCVDMETQDEVISLYMHRPKLPIAVYFRFRDLQKGRVPLLGNLASTLKTQKIKLKKYIQCILNYLKTLTSFSLTSF